MLTRYKFPLKRQAVAHGWEVTDFDDLTVARAYDEDVAVKIVSFLNAFQRGEILCP